MTRSISLLLISFCLLFFLTIYATANDKPEPYEEIYPKIGYKTVEDALDDFEQHFKQKLKLPLRVPPISFTHHFGMFSDLDGDINDSFEVMFINEKLSENHYKIYVRPIKNRIPISEKYALKTFELKNGIVANYMTISGFNVLVFERDDWQYMLNISKRVSDKVTPETLVDIANSIDY
ncbi:hypothetical protein MHH81_08840 [Psychrobacillus sp. FSL H8-0484]|uniref:hypothetical protein n=1 Tax=Psychrobacillus sp. FSL H8-0484 TaxID=2921390 RepID=UPI0030FB40DA